MSICPFLPFIEVLKPRQYWLHINDRSGTRLKCSLVKMHSKFSGFFVLNVPKKLNVDSLDDLSTWCRLFLLTLKRMYSDFHRVTWQMHSIYQILGSSHMAKRCFPSNLRKLLIHNNIFEHWCNDHCFFFILDV